MKKTCTASGCRRTFSYQKDELAVCPFCGKEYPRLGNPGSNAICIINDRKYDFSFLVSMKSFYKSHKASTVIAIRHASGISLQAARKLAEPLFHGGRLAAVVTVQEYQRIEIQEARRIW